MASGTLDLDVIVHVTDFPLIEKMWPALAPMLKPAVDASNGCYEVADVYADIQTGAQQLWIDVEHDNPFAINAAMTTMFDHYPRKKTLKVVFVGGKKMKKWLPEFRETIEQFGKKHGAVMLEGFFRAGWVKVWPGSRISGVGLVKDLT